MLVEDDGPIRESLRTILEMENYTVLEAENGRQALEHLNAGQIPSLLFLDLMMPVMDGVEFYNLLRNNPAWNDVTAVIISASGNLKDKLSQLGNPVPPVLKKPLELDAILTAAEKYCQR
jgi:CheY-like chemotaxis protein